MAPRGDVVVKRRPDAAPGFFAAEAAGLRWLAEAMPLGGAAVMTPLEPVDDDSRQIVLPRLAERPASPQAAEAFGRGLARTHAAGADWFGCPPSGWQRDGFIGPIPLPHNHSQPSVGWGEFFAHYRLEPYARAARDRQALSSSGAAAVDRVCSRLADGDPERCGPAEPPSRLHGDLWSGNVLWGQAGAVLIDPAAHGGHRESDLAMLALFGLPHLERVLCAYAEASPLAPGWRDRVELHQLFPVLVHAVLFGAGYGVQAAAIAQRHA